MRRRDCVRDYGMRYARRVSGNARAAIEISVTLCRRGSVVSSLPKFLIPFANVGL